MRISFGITKDLRKCRKPVLAIGVFDGLHLGHRQLIQAAVRRAKEIGGTPVVMTFSPHPVHVLHPEINLPLVASLPHRLQLIAQLGVRVCVVVRFTKAFSRLLPEQFIRKYLVEKIGVAEVFVGDDFRFGQDRAGTMDLFQEAGERFGFRVNAVSIRQRAHQKISSTFIRDLIRQGSLSQAARYLDRPVSVLGKVVRGDDRGKTLGYPTANIQTANVLLPPPGVYVARATLDKKSYQGVANIGYRPSFKNNGALTVEIHIFNFHRLIYGRDVIVEFFAKVRDEKSFCSRDDLVCQIKQDVRKARQWFKKHKKPF